MRRPDAAPDYCAIGLVNPKSPGERGSRDAGRRLLQGRRGLLHGAALRAGAAFATDTKQMVERSLLGVEDLLAFVPEGCTLRWWISSRGHLAAGLCAPRAGLLHLRPEDGTLDPAASLR